MKYCISSLVIFFLFFSVAHAGLFGTSVDIKDLQKKYDSERKDINVLIVPGHDLDYSGAVYNGLKEELVNRELAKHLYLYLKDDDDFNVITTRDFSTGEYTPVFKKYFDRQEKKIKVFKEKCIQKMFRAVADGDIDYQGTKNHSYASSDTSFRLYGINKWANENDIDLVIHIHFNDAGNGDYSGFAVYIPDSQFSNAKVSKDIANYIHTYFTKHIPPSNLPLESEGVIESQQLIALGSNGSLDAPSLLIEYGYIRESQFQHYETRQFITRELAYQTYMGLKNYFEDGEFEDKHFNTTFLPYDFMKLSFLERTKGTHILSLQEALRQEGLYPPKGNSLQECPLTGLFGECTKRAIIDFQKKYRKDMGSMAGVGIVDYRTKKKLQTLYGI